MSKGIIEPLLGNKYHTIKLGKYLTTLLACRKVVYNPCIRYDHVQVGLNGARLKTSPIEDGPISARPVNFGWQWMGFLADTGAYIHFARLLFASACSIIHQPHAGLISNDSWKSRLPTDSKCIKEMELLQRDPRHNIRKAIASRTKIDVKPFDVETTFAEVTAQKKRRVKKYCGPDSPLYSAIYPVVCIMKVFGIAPYDFEGDRLTPSSSCIVFTLAFLVIYSYIMYIVYLKFVNTTREKLILGVVETTKVVVNYLLMMYELVATIFTRRAFTRVWNDLQDFDEKLSELGYPRKERRIRILIWVLLVGLTISWTVVNQSGMSAFNEPWTFNAAYMLTYIGTSMCVYKFCGMVIFIGQRFNQLNQIAWENLPPIVGYKSSTVSRKTIQDLHDELMLIAEQLNAFSSWSLLFWLGNLCVHSVSNLYFIIDWVILKPWALITWALVSNMFAWLLVYISQLLMLHVGCDYTITEANSMGAILVQWDARVIQRFPHDDSVRASLHFLSRRLYFSAGGLFEVNLPLLCSIVGVLSTYLIILLQFPA